MADLRDALDALSSRLGSRANQLIASLETSGGNIVRSKENLAKVAQIMGDLRSSLIDDQFIEAVAEFVSDLDSIGVDVADSLAEFGDLPPDLLDDIITQFKLNAATDLLDPATYATGVLSPIANSIIIGIATSAALSATMQSVTDAAGGLGAAADPIATGVPATLQRALTVAGADELGLDFFRYQGRPIATTRDFCRDKEGHVWHRKEIEQWGKDAAAGDGWAGMVPGTNADTIFVHLGGYYGNRQVCRHSLVPLAKFDVPEEDLARMRSKGLID